LLDELLDGGLEPGSTWLIEGPPGGGKTLLGLHFLASGIVANEPGIIIAATESPDRLMRFCSQNWPDPSPFFTELRLHSHSRDQREHGRIWDEIWHFVQDVVQQSRNQGAKRIIIDPLTPLLLANENTITLWDTVQMIISAFDQNQGATTLLTHLRIQEPRFHEIGSILTACCTGVMGVDHIISNTGEHQIAIDLYKQRYHAQSRCRILAVPSVGGRLEVAEETWRLAA
jgi:circadian clock protein KaiC